MKSFFTLMLIPVITFLTGCVTGKNGIAFAPVGPAPNQPAAVNSTNGTLLVYSAYDANADFAGRNRRSPVYSDYKILATDDRLLQKVHNNSGTILQEAVPVELSPGKYHIMAHSNGYGYLVVPVIVMAGKTTTLHLEGDGFWPNELVFNQTNAVRLPDGVVIGWKAAN